MSQTASLPDGVRLPEAPERFPRVLVATPNTFNLVDGGGITLTNLFRGWPADRIANLHHDSVPSDQSVCRTFFRLTSHELPLAGALSLISPLAGRLRVAAAARGTRRPRHSEASGPHVQGAGRSGAPSLRRTITSAVFGDGVPRTAVLTPALKQWLVEVRPELVYGFLGSLAQIRLMRLLSEHTGAPMAVHLMDDWPAVTYRRGVIGPVVRRMVLRELGEILRQARMRMVISDAMAEEYRHRYGLPFLPFHNALDAQEWLPRARQEWGRRGPLIVRYAGSVLAEAQRDALADVCAAVDRIDSAGIAAQLWIHAPASQVAALRQPFSGFRSLRLESSPDPSGIVGLLASTDVLVLPFNFDARSAAYIRLSMPTKVPAYMMSGTPVLVYGPEHVAAVRYAAQGGWGQVVSRPGVEGLAAALRRLAEDESLRARLGMRAKALALQNHDAAVVRPAFQAALCAAASGDWASPGGPPGGHVGARSGQAAPADLPAMAEKTL